MSLRAVVVALIVLATIGFVVGTTIERNSKESHTESPAASHSAGAGESQPAAGESEAHRAAESGGESAHGGEGSASGSEGTHGEFQPFGVNIEAVPFIVLAALASLVMAAAVWLRPRSPLILGAVALAMVLFAALDVREIVHQIDENRTGLAVLAGVIAVLHLAAAAAIVLLARGEQRMIGPAGTVPA